VRDQRPAGWRGLFDIVRWDYRERFGDASQFAARSSVLILRSARAVEVPQIRAGVRASRRMRRGPASPGCACSLFSSCLLLLWAAIRADPRGPGRTHFPWSSWSLRESHRRQVVPGLLFFSCCLQENRGTEWVEPRARSLIAAGRLAMLAAVR